jgi:hypothetical protein
MKLTSEVFFFALLASWLFRILLCFVSVLLALLGLIERNDVVARTAFFTLAACFAFLARRSGAWIRRGFLGP